MMRVFVTGAAGYIGARMVESLCEQDWTETVVGLDIKDPPKEFPKYKFIKQDIREPLSDILEAEGINTVAHLAYVLPPIHNKGLMEDINKGGTMNVLEASSKAKVKHILYTSSTTAYGFYPDNDTPLTEDSPLRGNDEFTYAKNKKEIEGILQGFIKRHPEITVTIVRPCFVVGPGFNNPMASHLQKKFVMLPSNTQPFQFVHEDDLMNIMILFIKERIEGVYNVAAEGTMTFAEMIKMLGNIPIPIPWPIIYVLNNLAWYLRLSFITEYPSPAMRLMVNPWLATSEKLIRKTGYRFKYDSRGAFEDFARFLRGGMTKDSEGGSA
jgi:UDP-glucose 4-epimerase